MPAIYSQIMVDPPWPKGKAGLRKVRAKQTKSLDYQTLTVAEIFTILDGEIFPQATDTHNVFMWTIDGFLHESECLMQERGYRRHARLIWDKGNGIAPAFTVRYTHEYLVWFYKPKLLPIAREQRGKWTTVLSERSRQHSRKPDVAYRLIRELYPIDNCLDVFSREERPGWAQWGNQTDYFKAVTDGESRTQPHEK